jgi:hypothetical protein
MKPPAGAAPASGPDLKTHLQKLRTALARAAFWRRSAAAPQTPAAPPDADMAPTEAAIEPTPPRRIMRILGRLAGWRRRPPAMPGGDAEAPEAAQDEDAPPPPADEAAAPAPRRSRHSALLTRKWLWLPAGALTLIALSAFTTQLVLRRATDDREQALHALQVAQAKLEQENRLLRARPGSAPPPAAPAAPPPPDTLPITKHDPAFDVAPAPTGPVSDKGQAGDCMVADKDHVGTSLRRCIEAFNRATSGTAKK